MMVGFGFQNPGEPDGDRSALEAAGCEKIFLRPSLNKGDSFREFAKLADLLRSGDTLVVLGLDRLGDSLEAVVTFVAQLHRSGVGVRVEQDGVAHDNQDMFGRICVMLNNLAEALTIENQQKLREHAVRKRGRPVVMTTDIRGRAEKLLTDGTLSVSEVAQLLGVSTATVYRWVPSRKSKVR